MYSCSKIRIFFDQRLSVGQNLLELHHSVAAMRDEDGNRKCMPDLVAFFAKVKHGDQAKLRGLFLC